MDGEAIAALAGRFLKDPLQLVAAVDLLGDGPSEHEGPELWRYKDNLKDTVAVLQLIERQCGTSPPWNSLPMLTTSLHDVDRANLDDEISTAEGDRVFCRFLDALETFRAAVLVNDRLQHPDAAAATPDASGDEVPRRFCDRSGNPIGPLTGTRTEIATAIRGVYTRPEQLQTMHKNGRVFMRKLGRRTVEVFFRSSAEFSQAASRMSKPDSRHNSRQQLRTGDNS